MADSREVAERFGKRHADVLRSVESLDCSADFSERNFASAEYLDAQGKPRSRFDMTRDGLTFLVMGFTGSEAAIWKERYIAAFNAMEASLRSAPAIPQTISEALRYAADEHDRANEAEAKVAVLVIENEKLTDDSAALARISAADDTILLSEAAKHFGIGPIKFNRMLHTWGWIFKRPGSRNWIAYEGAYRKHFEHKEHIYQKKDGSDGVNTYAVLVASGLEAVAKKLEREAKQAGKAA